MDTALREPGVRHRAAGAAPATSAPTAYRITLRDRPVPGLRPDRMPLTPARRLVMAGPLAGMKALAGCLRPDGVMLYARYSRIGSN
jgi:hypothetical protein